MHFGTPRNTNSVRSQPCQTSSAMGSVIKLSWCLHVLTGLRKTLMCSSYLHVAGSKTVKADLSLGYYLLVHGMSSN